MPNPTPTQQAIAENAAGSGKAKGDAGAVESAAVPQIGPQGPFYG
jgi:hypothetical protein